MKQNFIIELNEFNLNILKIYAKKFNLHSLNKILQFNITRTFTRDRYIGDNNQSGYLDPWTQWVSIHTQTLAKKHKIKNLGDTTNLNFKQIWEKSKKTYFIWGVMNSSRKKRKNVKIFFPDPWSFTEKAYPSTLNNLFNSIKIFTKTRGELTLYLKIFHISIICKNLIKLGGLKNILISLYILFMGILKFNFKPLSFIVAWEILSFNILIKLIKKLNYKKKFNIIFFINCLAHVQHHYWSHKKKSKEIKFILSQLDKYLFKILLQLDLNLIIINGMSQKNSEKNNLCLYEQYDHAKLLNEIGIKTIKIEKFMTNDATIFFKNNKELINAQKILTNIKFKNRKIFHVEKNSHNSLFYKTNFIKFVKKKDKIIINKKKKLIFLKYFKFITVRKGIHHHEGNIISKLKIFPKKIENHKIFDYLL